MSVSTSRLRWRLVGLICSTLIPGACGSDDPASLSGTGEAVVLEPTDLCTEHADIDVVSFADDDLEDAVRDALEVGGPLTCSRVARLRRLEADGRGIGSLVGIQNLTGLEYLTVINDSVDDIRPVSALTELRALDLGTNQITELPNLDGLTNLRRLWIGSNRIEDLSPLTDLPVLTHLDA